MCEICIDKINKVILDIIRAYKVKENQSLLICLLEGLDRLKNKLLEMIVLETLLNLGSIKKIDFHLMSQVFLEIEEIDINEAVISRELMQIYNDLR